MFEPFKLETGFDFLVKKRYSCRTFDGKGIEAHKLKKLVNEINDINGRLKDIRFGIVNKKILKSKNFFSQGTYGMFKGDVFYIVGIIKKGVFRGWENFGFYMENLIMIAENLKLNTCWIGGVFDRKGFGAELNLSEDEIVPAVVPIGYAAKKRSLQDKIVRWSAKGDKRKDSEKLFFLKDFSTPFNYNLSKEISECLENIRLAPSASNKQPWRLLFNENRVDFFIRRDRLYSKFIPLVDLQKIDMGIALFHFIYSIKERKIKGSFIKMENPYNNKQLEYIISYKFDDIKF
jgi:nitroreductase